MLQDSVKEVTRAPSAAGSPPSHPAALPLGSTDVPAASGAGSSVSGALGSGDPSKRQWDEKCSEQESERGGDTSPHRDSGERPGPEGLLTAVGVCWPTVQLNKIQEIQAVAQIVAQMRRSCNQSEECWALASELLATHEEQKEISL